jgi:hypothetical protein
LLTRALIGLPDYQAALRELETDDNSLTSENDYYRGQIYLGLGEWQKAKDVFAALRRGQKENELLDAYIVIADLKVTDHVGAQKVTCALLKIWQDFLSERNIDEPVPGLELAGDVMKHKGFDKEAKMLLDEAARVKLTDRIEFEGQSASHRHHRKCQLIVANKTQARL